LFLNDEAFDRLPNPIATTKYGEYRYAGLMPEADICSYVIDEVGLMMLYEDPRFEVVSLLMLSPEEILIERVGEERVKRCKSVVDVTNFDYFYDNIYSIGTLTTDICEITELILKSRNMDTLTKIMTFIGRNALCIAAYGLFAFSFVVWVGDLEVTNQRVYAAITLLTFALYIDKKQTENDKRVK
jgi:hypothetical protein